MIVFYRVFNKNLGRNWNGCRYN